MVAGVILAGGGSKRFGSDKRYYRLNGKTLIEACCDKINEVCENNYIVADKDFSDQRSYAHGFTVLRDLEDGKGPLMGVYTALSHIVEEGCLVIPVDMPGLSVSLLKYIKSQAPLFDLAIPSGDELFPLPGYYSKELLPLIVSSFEGDDFSLKALVGRAEESVELKVLRISFEKIKKFGAPQKVLFNINMENDVEKFQGS
ncbi:MAG: molybdenum cofactor guanylyltransferase [Candidatus Dadabacteria bacterium]|nr:molybdenum cofactor guanylyltransferase [Candidatus Dadabacteria bacterium]